MNLFHLTSLLTAATLLIASSSRPSLAADDAREVATVSGTTSRLLDRLAVDKLKIVDLSHVINSKTPDFFGDKDIYHFSHSTTAKEDGYSTGTFQTPEHFGTHVDAPVHFAKGASPIDKIPVKRLVLPAVVIDIRKHVGESSDCVLTVPMIEAWESEHGKIPSNAAILLLTGWSQRWDSEKEYRNVDAQEQMHFPAYSEDAAKFLIDERNATAIGVDTLSIDPGNSKSYPVHKVAANRDVYIIENLTNLDDLPALGSLLFCGCPALEGGTGCPSRVIAIVDQVD